VFLTTRCLQLLFGCGEHVVDVRLQNCFHCLSTKGTPLAAFADLCQLHFAAHEASNWWLLRRLTLDVELLLSGDSC
jgi:hypothetical protein